MDKSFTIRKAERKDVGLLLDFIRGIAKYEKMEDEVVATAEVLESEMFDHHRAEAVFAVVDGKEVGFALSISRHSSGILDCTLKIYLCGQNIVDEAMEKPCYCIWRR